MSEDAYQGAVNAVKKAYQLTSISFTPYRPIAYNIGSYKANVTYKGMIYSSVKEIGTYVGSSISFHTFMTAVHNPRSKLYTQRIDISPYYGTNCRAYYGTVCSGLVSYALGLFPLYGSYDFVVSDSMTELDYTDVDGFHLADVLWKPGHVAIISNVIRDIQDKVLSIEIAEAVQNGCRRYTVTRSDFENRIFKTFNKILRYNRLEDNISYTSAPEFVAVLDEESVPFDYNTDLCVDKGDRSCYFVGEDVVLNLFSDGDYVEVYKDGSLFAIIEISAEDICLSDLEFGSYQARLVSGERYSGYTSWIMVDCSIYPSPKDMRICFGSKNSTPLSIFFGSQNGGRIPFTEILCRRFFEEEVENGCISLSEEKTSTKYPYFVITFSTEFGNISTTPILFYQ